MAIGPLHADGSVRPPRPPRGTLSLRIAIVFLAASLFGCDHATKLVASATLTNGRAVPLVDGLLELRFAANDDTAFSLLRALGVPRSPAVLVAAASIAFLGVVAFWIGSRKQASRLQHVGFAMVIGGALGNLVDRAVRGYVVDFIHVTRWPVFNVADIAVVIGMVLLGLASLRRSPPARAAPSPRQ